MSLWETWTFGDLWPQRIVGHDLTKNTPIRVWRPGPGNSRSREFFIFFYGIGTGIEKIWYRKKSRNRNWKNLVPKKVSEPESKIFGTEKSLGTGLEKFWCQKKSQNRFQKSLVWKKNIGTSLEIFQNISVDLGPDLVSFPGILHFFDGIPPALIFLRNFLGTKFFRFRFRDFFRYQIFSIPVPIP